jgi:alkylation response protein AidB-like acyl-CoA dehydrogenase
MVGDHISTDERRSAVQLVLDAEHGELRATVRKFLSDHAPLAKVREAMISELGYDANLWRRMADELGILGLTVPEELGGAGAGHIERAIVQEELGRHLTPSPFLASAVLATDLLLALDDPAARSDLLPRMTGGELIAAVAIAEDRGVWASGGATAARGSAEQWLLTGSKAAVIAGDIADVLLVYARAEAGPAWFLVKAADAPQGLRRTTLTTLDPTRRLARIDFDATPATMLLSGDPVDVVNRVFNLGGVALAAEQLGGLERILQLTVEYAKVRIQFGRPIGSYQAVKHGCADMYCDWELGQSALRYASWSADHAPEELPAAAALALAYLGPAYFRAATGGVQYHGGIGFTWEHDAHLYYKRAKSTELLFGSPSLHRSKLASCLGI